MIKKEIFATKTIKLVKFSEGFFRHVTTKINKRIANSDNPRTISCIGQIYPWQVAPQQSLIPFPFDNTKVSIFEEIDKTSIFFSKKVLPLQNKCKAKTGLRQKCKVLSGHSHKKCKVFLGRDTLCNSVSSLWFSV